jgi:hypothetical protein
MVQQKSPFDGFRVETHSKAKQDESILVQTSLVLKFRHPAKPTVTELFHESLEAERFVE